MTEPTIKKTILFEDAADMDIAELANQLRRQIILLIRNGELSFDSIRATMLPTHSRRAISFLKGRTNAITTPVLCRLMIMAGMHITYIRTKEINVEVEY